MFDDRVEKRAQKQYATRERQRAGERAETVRNLMKSSYGRDFLYWLLAEGGLGRNPFSTNALAMSFSCGELNMAQKLLAEIIDASPEGYLVMLKEQENARRIIDAARDRDANAGADFFDESRAEGANGG